MLIEIHMIQNFSPSNLNRGESGEPKSCLHGGVERTYLSSQCQKRAIRNLELFKSEVEKLSICYQTRLLPMLVKKALLSKQIPENISNLVAEKVSIIGTKATNGSSELSTKQIVTFSSKELECIVEVMHNLVKHETDEKKVEKLLKNFDFDLEVKANIQRHSDNLTVPFISPEIALFGRMSTSSALNTFDSCVQVMPALSINKGRVNIDYYVSIDNLVKGQAGFMESEGDKFSSPLFYRYFNLDFDSFCENMSASKEDNLKEYCRSVALAFIKASIEAIPSGKQSKWAAFQLPSAILIELKPEKRALNYANAFVRPLERKDDIIKEGILQFSDFVSNYTRKHNLEDIVKFWWTDYPYEGIQIKNSILCDTINDLLENVKNKIQV